MSISTNSNETETKSNKTKTKSNGKETQSSKTGKKVMKQKND